MGSPADYTIIVMLAVVGVAVWTLLDRMGQLQRDVDALKKKLGAGDPGAPEARAESVASSADSAR
jgi:hypothetical protein